MQIITQSTFIFRPRLHSVTNTLDSQSAQHAMTKEKKNKYNEDFSPAAFIFQFQFKEIYDFFFHSPSRYFCSRESILFFGIGA